jgi:3-mercaptopyruvate sulfurtransferase SseA
MFASKEEVLEAMNGSSVATVNVLPLVSYEASHIVGSICLPCMDLMQGDLRQGMDYLLPDDKLALRLKEVSHYKRIITYCGGGIAAQLMPWSSRHENVRYNGSLYEWLGLL